MTLYKTLLLVQKKANRGKERSSDTFIAGLIGGYIVFGDRNAINEQVSTLPFDRLINLNDTHPSSCYRLFFMFAHE